MSYGRGDTLMNNITDLPSFCAPPVDEVAIAVQFQGIDRFSLAYGTFYESVRERLPEFEEHDPIAIQFETFGRPRDQLPEFSLEAFSLRRGWYVSADGHKVVQLQPNRLVQNWRRQSGVGEYPRFPAVLTEFWNSFEALESVTRGLGLAMPEINQADVTYFNNIELFEGETYPEAFQRVFEWPSVGGLSGEANGFRLEPEACNLSFRARVFAPDAEAPCARLVATAEPSETEDGKKIVRFWLRFRGPPTHIDRDGLERFLLVGRVAIVKSFTDLTSKVCHTLWQRER